PNDQGRKNYENTTKQYDFIEDDRARRSDPHMQLSRGGFRGSAGEKASGREASRRPRNAPTRAKGIRHAETGGRCSHSDSNKPRSRRREGNSGPGRRGHYQFRRSGDGQESGDRFCEQGKRKDVGRDRQAQSESGHSVGGQR